MSVNLKTYLKDILTADELELLVRSYDVVGDMAILIIPEELAHREQVIGEAVLANNSRIRVVARRDGYYTGEFRTIPLKILAGENRKETLHREYGVKLLVNPEEVYFSVRSGTERARIAGLVEPGENVLVCFSGIGPYPLVIAFNSEAEAVVGIEKNPRAHFYACKNLKLNRNCEHVRLLEGDVLEVVPLLDTDFDRAVMPLPHGGEQFLPVVLSKLKKRGWLHLYTMLDRDSVGQAVENIQEICHRAGRKLITPATVKAGHCAPGKFRICIEGEVY